MQHVTRTTIQIVHSRLYPLCTTHDKYLLAFIVEQNLVGILAVMHFVFCCHLGIDVTCHRTIM